MTSFLPDLYFAYGVVLRADRVLMEPLGNASQA